MSRILIVEDEDHLATGIKFNLEIEGYEVEVIGRRRARPRAAGRRPRRTARPRPSTSCSST